MKNCKVNGLMIGFLASLQLVGTHKCADLLIVIAVENYAHVRIFPFVPFDTMGM